MTWRYRITTGTLTHDGVFAGTGYSGLAGFTRNNPAAVDLVGKGPIRPGKWRIGEPYDHPVLGPCVMNLDPEPETVTHGRSLFRIHGDNARHDASHGCIILGPAIRHQIRDSADNQLEVIS